MLLADGGRVAIEDVVVGDVVWATDPETGVSAGREVTAVWSHGDWLIELDTSHGPITTTEDHHFWNATDQAWQETRHIDPGDQLTTTAGVTVTVYGLDETTWHHGTAYDLTVDQTHTYYVTTSTTAAPQSSAPTSALDDAVPNTNPFDGPVDQDVFVVDRHGTALDLSPGESLTSSPDGMWLQVRGPDGSPTGVRLDWPHNPNTHTDPRALVPHAHVPGVTNADGTPWLPRSWIQ